MQQVVLHQPGEFRWREVSDPQTAAGEALVRVRRIGVCGTDLHAFAGRQPFFEYPRVLGHELGVEVLEVGPNNRGLSPGDLCAVEPYLECGHCVACRRGKTNCCRELRVLGVHIDGGMGPQLALPIEKLHPANHLILDQLALVETLGIGAHAVERGAPEPQEWTLVLGAGPIGLGVVQFALASEAKVVVADINASRLEFCRSALGVQHTIVSSQGDILAQLSDITGGQLPTLVFDATGNAASMQASFQLADHGGRIVFVGLFLGDVTFNDPHFHRRELTLLASRNSTSNTFARVLASIESGAIDTRPWLTHRLAFDDVIERFPALLSTPDLIKAIIEV